MRHRLKDQPDSALFRVFRPSYDGGYQFAAHTEYIDILRREALDPVEAVGSDDRYPVRKPGFFYVPGCSPAGAFPQVGRDARRSGPAKAEADRKIGVIGADVGEYRPRPRVFSGGGKPAVEFFYVIKAISGLTFRNAFSDRRGLSRLRGR